MTGNWPSDTVGAHPNPRCCLKVTRNDIAAAAGVSRSTVGMILSGKGENYSADTRALVMETAEQLGYKASINARALRMQRSFLIGVLLNEVNVHLSAQFLLGVQKAIGATDYSPVVFFTKAEADQDHCLDHCLNRQVDALIVNCSVEDTAGAGFRAFASRVNALPIPVVEVFGRFLTDVPKVNCDNATSGRQCAAHLADLGHRRIALITHERYERREMHTDAWEQFAGYREELAARGLEPIVIAPGVNFERIDASSFVQAGSDALDQLLALEDRPTAVVCYNDLMAYGLNRACRDRGIRVPQELSIMGSLDMLLSSVVNPPLTTMREDHFEIGNRAATLLLQALAGEETTDQWVAPEFLVRQSTAAPSA